MLLYITNITSHLQHILLSVAQLYTKVTSLKNKLTHLYTKSIISRPATTTVHCMHFGVGELHVPLLHVAKFVPIII